MNTFNYPFTKRASRRKRNRYRLCEISVATLDNKATNKISTNFKFPSTNYKSGKSEIFRMQIFRVERRTRDFENKRTREFDRDDSAARRNNFCPPLHSTDDPRRRSNFRDHFVIKPRKARRSSFIYRLRGEAGRRI